MSTCLSPLSQFILRRRALAGVALAVLFAGIGYVLRYDLVEPVAIGSMCRSVQAALWCPLRTGLIFASEWNSLGYLSVAAALSLTAPYWRAVTFAFIAMAIGGVGLMLYNATVAAPGVLLVLLRLAACRTY